LEYWNDGMMGRNGNKNQWWQSFTQYSTIPSFHYSSLSFQHQRPSEQVVNPPTSLTLWCFITSGRFASQIAQMVAR
jgi:hypothetical protein